MTGTLTFVVGTAVNNGLGDARIVRLDQRGFFTTFYNGVAYPDSYLDSGTMAYIVAGGSVPRYAQMAWALCLEPSQAFAATMIGATDEGVPTSFLVGDYQAIGDHRLGAFDGAAITADEGSKSFVWGAPYFLGKRITLVFEGLDASGEIGQPGPFFAIKSPTWSDRRPTHFLNRSGRIDSEKRSNCRRRMCHEPGPGRLPDCRRRRLWVGIVYASLAAFAILAIDLSGGLPTLTVRAYAPWFNQSGSAS